MRKFLITAVVLMLLITGLGAFSIVSFADVETPSIDVSDELNVLSVPEGENYAFYAQTRQNRLDANKTDVRIICVADQEWLSVIPNYVATFTFTDGTTPKTLKSVGLDMVFKEIVAYGTEGNVETFVAAEGAVIFGWIITDVPAEYADISTNKPTVSVVTDAGIKPEYEIEGPDYDTVVTEKVIDILNDGILSGVQPDYDRHTIGWIDSNSKMTYIVTGNYEGVYALDVSYLSQENRRLSVTVNGERQLFRVFDTTSDWNDPNVAATQTLFFEMKKGANVITVEGFSGSGPNLAGLTLRKQTLVETGDSKLVKAPLTSDNTAEGEEGWSFTSGVQLEDISGNPDERRIGYLNADQTATYTYTDMAAGTYRVIVKYMTCDDPDSGYKRALGLTVNGGNVVGYPCGKTESWNNPEHALEIDTYVTFTEGTNTLTLSGFQNYGGSNGPCVYSVTLIPTTAQ